MIGCKRCFQKAENEEEGQLKKKHNPKQTVKKKKKKSRYKDRPGPNPISLRRSLMTLPNSAAKGLWRVDDKLGLRFT